MVTMGSEAYQIQPIRNRLASARFQEFGSLIGELPTPTRYSRGVRVTEDCLLTVLGKLNTKSALSLDTETTGLYPYKGDKMFAMIISDGDESFYFNFNYYGEERGIPLLSPHSHKHIANLLCQKRAWYLFNAKFDCAFLRKFFNFEHDWFLREAFDGKALARLENNYHMNYSLDDCAKRVGLEKDDRVMEYIVQNKLYTWVDIPGKSVRQKILHFDKVPANMMFEYGCLDAEITYKHAEKVGHRLLKADPEGKMKYVHNNEVKLLRNISRMEYVGLKINRSFVGDAVIAELAKDSHAKKNFKALTGKEYAPSPKLMAEIFEEDKPRWKYTDKNNPSFDSDVLKTFENPAAKCVLNIRDAKSKMDFYNGFIYYADIHDVVHPNLDPAGTATGRFSSSSPNFQNLTNEEEDTEDGFLIRRAIVPRLPENILVSIDYSQQEYRLMLDYAGEMDLIYSIMNGADVHQATADMMGVSRKEAKTLNFMLLYGGGAQKLADALGIDLEDAKRLKRLYFSKLPRVQDFIESATSTAKERGYVFNWLGRRLHFPNPEFAYKAANAIIQGGGADIMKVAINNVYDYLDGQGVSGFIYPILTVHDELILEGDKHYMIAHLPKIKEIMEKSYPHKNIPMACTVSWSDKSLAEPDMIQGLPT